VSLLQNQDIASKVTQATPISHQFSFSHRLGCTPIKAFSPKSIMLILNAALEKKNARSIAMMAKSDMLLRRSFE
jgi:hypothetical protein